METKEIANSLRCCVSSESCKSCGFLDNQQCRITMKIIAANRLEELESEIAELKQQLSEQPSEWISVEDEPLPKLSCEINRMWYRRPNDLPVYIAFYGNGASNGVTHWMQLDPPKPKVQKFRKKPVVVEAYKTEKEIVIHTLEGDMTASVGDFIITGVNGEQYPCRPDIFEKTYEPYFEEEGGGDA